MKTGTLILMALGAPVPHGFILVRPEICRVVYADMMLPTKFTFSTMTQCLMKVQEAKCNPLSCGY